MNGRWHLNEKMFCVITVAAILVVLSLLLHLVNAGIAPGLEAGHPPEYLRTSFIACSLLMMSVPAMWYFDLVKLPVWFVALIFANVYYYCMSLFFGFYLTIEWWGTVAHVISSMFVCSIVFLALCIIKHRSPAHVSLGSKYSIIFLQIMIGICFGGIWEVMEGYIDIVLGQDYMSYGVWDMLEDLRADVAGAVIMGSVFLLLLKRYSVEEVACAIYICQSKKEPSDVS